MPRSRAGTRGKAKGRAKVGRTKKPPKKPKARARGRKPRPGKISREKLIRELTKLRRSVTAFQRTLTKVPGSQVIAPGSEVDGTISWCTKGGPLVAMPVSNECRLGTPLKAALFKRSAGRIGLLIDCLIQQAKR